MALLSSFQDNVNNITNKVRNPFSDDVNVDYGPDFKEGFLIEEILDSGNIGDTVTLAGNMLPKKKVPFGGSQRMKKEFYSGYSEPVIQIFGPEETDIVIEGEFKDKRYNKDSGLRGVSLEVAQLIDAIRIRGNLVRITLGELQRYGYIANTAFDLEQKTKVPYKITFAIVGFNKPRNAKFINNNKEAPFAIQKDLIAQATAFQQQNDNIPDSVPRSIADKIKALTSEVATVMATVTGFIDSIINSVEDIRASIARVQGLIKFAQNKVRGYKQFIGGIKPFQFNQSLSRTYYNQRYFSGAIASCGPLVALLERLRSQMSGIGNNLPLGRHLVRQGDNLQKIAIKFYKTADNWKKIYDYNNLTSTELVIGRLLEIPRP